MIKEELLDKLLKKVKTIDKINDCDDNKKRVYLKPTKEDTIIFASLSLFLILNACCWVIFSDQHIAAIIGIVIFLQILFKRLLFLSFKNLQFTLLGEKICDKVRSKDIFISPIKTNCF